MEPIISGGGEHSNAGGIQEISYQFVRYTSTWIPEQGVELDGLIDAFQLHYSMILQ